MTGPFMTYRHRRRPAVNITSLIDVMFLLLIFFMVSSTFRDQLGVDIDLPAAATAASQEAAPNEIVVTRDGEFLLGAQPVDEAGLRTALEAMAQDEEKRPVVLRADEKADFGRVLRAIDIAREVGGTRLIIPTEPAGESPQP